MSINRRRRVLIIFPALEERFYHKAQSLDVDGVIIDLEDGIALSHKKEARQRMKNFLTKYPIHGKELIIRINSFKSGYGLMDLEVALECEPNSIMYPKTEEPNEIEQLDNILSENQARLGYSKQIDIIPLIETPIGLLRADEILNASQRVIASILGTEDLCSIFMTERKPITEIPLLLHGIASLSFIAKALRISLIDGIFPYIGEESLSALRRECLASRSLGAVGKIAIHPSQISVIREMFSKTKSEITELVEIIASLSERGKKDGITLIRHGNRLYGSPMFTWAKNLFSNTECEGNMNLELEKIKSFLETLGFDCGGFK